MANSRVRISTHIADDQPQETFVGRGETAWHISEQCPDCARKSLATNGTTRWCTVCGYHGSVRHPERVKVERDEH